MPTCGMAPTKAFLGDTDMNEPHETRVSITKTDAKKQMVWGEVYVPYVPDSQGDYMTPEEIERVAHNFLRKGDVKAIDTEHSLLRNGSVVVESFVAREGDADFAPGAWVLGVHIPDKAAWAKAESGEIGGFSMYGTGRRQQRIVEIEVPDDGVLFGKTAATSGDAAHDHAYMLELGANGEFIGGETDEVNGHSHEIKKGTVTEPGPDGHRHRFSFIDTLAKGCSGMTDEQKKWKAIRENQKKKRMEKWDESEHPRGKTTPESNDGSFAPDGGGGGRVEPSEHDKALARNDQFNRDQAKQAASRSYTEAMNALTRSGHRPLSTIAREIRRDWGGKVHYSAKPYLDALGSLHDIKDNYYEDSGASVVAYLLGNMHSWKGPKAREIKAELNKILKIRKADMEAEDLPETDGEQKEVRCKKCQTPKACGKAGRCLISYEEEADEDEAEEEDET